MVWSGPFRIRHFVALFFVWMALLSSGVLAQAEHQMNTTADPDLQAMDDVELEQICTNLGFALQKDIVDDATGELIVFTHDDYVEAARQCLSIEKELEEVLAEHPEILEEMEAERNRMLQEKERLEQELEKAKQRQADLSEKPLSAAFLPTTTKEEVATTGEGQQMTTNQKVASDDAIEEQQETATRGKAASEQATNTTGREASDTSHQQMDPALLEEEERKFQSVMNVATDRGASDDTPQQETQQHVAPALLEEERKVQNVMEVLDELLLTPFPEPVKEIIRQVFSQMRDDIRQVVRLIRRHADPLIGQLVKSIRMRIKDSDNPLATSLKAIFDKSAASLKLQESEQVVEEQSAPVG